MKLHLWSLAHVTRECHFWWSSWNVYFTWMFSRETDFVGIISIELFYNPLTCMCCIRHIENLKTMAMEKGSTRHSHLQAFAMTRWRLELGENGKHSISKFSLDDVRQILLYLKQVLTDRHAITDPEITQCHIYYLSWFGDRPPAAFAAVCWLVEN